MRIEKVVVGELSENCHLCIDDKSHCLVIDPGDEGEKICSFIQNQNLTVKGILLTHGHFDHIMATAFLKEKFNCPVVISECDEEMILSDEKNMGAYMGVHVTPFKVDLRVNDKDVIDIGDFRINVIATPGHTKGSVVYRIDDVLFTGDTLFKNCVGRTDLYGGNAVKLMQSLKKLCELEGEYEFHAGHGASGTLCEEKQNNPWLKSVV